MLNVENDNIKPENGNITPSEVDLKRANIIADTFVERLKPPRLSGLRQALTKRKAR